MTKTNFFSCGSECKNACGTRHFRTCCFNYVKKRSENFHPHELNRLNYDLSYYGPPTLDNSDEKEKHYKNNEAFNEITARSNFDTPYNDKSPQQVYQTKLHQGHQQQLIFDK